MVKVGCCGFPKGMKKYFSQFKLVEVQQTFYKPPLPQTAMKWREEAPGDFEFCLKAWQLITHSPSSPTYRKAGIVIPPEKADSYGSFKATKEVMAAWQRTEQIAKALKARVILFQCPPHFRESQQNIENMSQFFGSIKREFLFAWEPRGGWSDSRVKAICEELDLVHCVDPLDRPSLYGGAKYFRLHGGPGYRHIYTDAELEQLGEMGGGEEVYILFNNLNMYDDALRFIRLLG